MRLLQSKRWRHVGLATAFVVIAIGGFWLYLIATTSSVNRANFRKLRTDMTCIEVEATLGGPATKARPAQELVKRGPAGLEAMILGEGFHPIPGMHDEYGTSEWGTEFGDKAVTIWRAKDEWREIVDVHLWDGPEARIVVSFDDEGRMQAARIIERVTWRYKLKQWLPWLK